MEFIEFVLSYLPDRPAQVLEIGCGDEGGLVPELAHAGYDVLGIDPHAPDGPAYRRISLEELEEPARFDAVVASRVLHHVEPLDGGLDKLARLAPLLLVDDFAHERIDGPTRAWYEARYRELAANGPEPKAPADLGEWRWRHPGLHSGDAVLAALEPRYDALFSERRPYFYRWLRDPATERVERDLIAAGEIQAIGLRYAGVARTETVRSAAPSR
ncbi:MAG TPA: methyltransferase domain-containing protein [Gaiellaceae bacterium]|jgi:SAM-dependent methyltransferase